MYFVHVITFVGWERIQVSRKIQTGGKECQNWRPKNNFSLLWFAPGLLCYLELAMVESIILLDKIQLPCPGMMTKWFSYSLISIWALKSSYNCSDDPWQIGPDRNHNPKTILSRIRPSECIVPSELFLTIVRHEQNFLKETRKINTYAEQLWKM